MNDKAEIQQLIKDKNLLIERLATFGQRYEDLQKENRILKRKLNKALRGG
jgi:flagellar biosynthesis/type III secretory pathway chaperone